MKKYYKPTPVKWRKLGDAFLLFSAGLSGAVMGLPISDNSRTWVLFAVNIVGIIGKVITNFAGPDEDQPVTPPQP